MSVWSHLNCSLINLCVYVIFIMFVLLCIVLCETYFNDILAYMSGTLFTDKIVVVISLFV